MKIVYYKVEGIMEFVVLMYIFLKKFWNYNMGDMEYGLSLYIKWVFIMDNCKDFLLIYLCFVKGFVDSSDLFLNVLCEFL